MTSRFLLQTSLSPLVTRPRNIFYNRQPPLALTFYSRFGLDAVKSTNSGMPVIHAVAAHRHCHNLCQQPHLVQASSLGLLYVKSRSEVRSRRSVSFVSADPLLEGGPCQVPSKSASSTSGWLKIRSKSFLTSGKSILNSNVFGASSIHDNCDLESRRSYSKTKDKGAKKKTVVLIKEDEINEVINVDAFKGQMENVLKQMKDEYASQLSIRGAAGALELLEVEFEGEKYPLQELAQIGRKNPQLAVLNLASLPEACQPVLKAIQESGMQLNPQQEGTTIYIPLPKVTREHREGLAKNAKVIFTKYKSSFQDVQNRYIKKCKSNKDISEDVVFNVTQQLMRMTEMYIGDAEKVLHEKQKELLDTIS